MNGLFNLISGICTMLFVVFASAVQGQSGTLTNCPGDYEIPISHKVVKTVQTFPAWRECAQIEKSGKRDRCTSQHVAEFIHSKTPKSMPLAGEFWISFIVEENGCLSNIEMVDPDNSEEGWVALEIVRNMPLWSPGIDKDGSIRRVEMRIPVKFASQ